MRIIHLEASTGWGGQEIRILSEAIGMRQRGHEIFFAVAKGAALKKKAKEAGFIVHEIYYKKPSWLFTFFYLSYLFCKYRIDIVNTHSSLDAWIGGIAARMSGKSIIRTRHLSTAIKQGWNSRLLYRYLADFIVTTCEKIVSVVCEQSGKASFYCRSIPTGMDPSLIRYAPDEPLRFREKMKLSQEDFLVGSVCMVRSWKGIEDFLKAANLLRGEKDIQWVIIGGGHLEAYQKKACEMDLSSFVTFTGHLESPFGAMAALDAFVLLSTNHEGVSQASLQAAYLQKPLITTPTGGLKEVCLPNVTGLQVSVFSPKEVAEAVLKLKRDYQLRKRLGRGAKSHVEKHFMFQEMLDRMEEIYFLLKSKKKGIFEKR
jgi:glycosyltransferase involved in cell wall biosynthesis